MQRFFSVFEMIQYLKINQRLGQGDSCITQLVITCSKITIGTLEQGVG